ncbi:MAG: SNF2-related protein, partial [Planctomycetota bacterium]
KKYFLPIVDELGESGWKILLEDKPVKKAGEFNVSVESGQDWFDLAVNVEFDDQSIAMPELLQAIVKKDNFVTLADGSQGRIPPELLEKYSRLAAFGQIKDDKVRFRPTQAMLLDAMLDAKEVKVDKKFRAFRKKLQSFDGVKPKSPPRGFKGELRRYQRDGLGWLHFLREFGLGGCLADDMGLGKTVQVLSLLESRRNRKVNLDESQDTKKKANLENRAEKKSVLLDAAEQLKRKPSIVIVPKSLIFNWVEEAAKFTPRLRLLNYTGTKRLNHVQVAIDSGGFDVLLTTYGTMRRDIEVLSQLEFDYAILDESQAIKNSKAQCAKSSRLLNADYRLAMTGTPIENHLGELWSLFEFLNPGMLGNSTNFARLTNQKKSNEAEREETLAALAKAIAPFLLRRTKEQVLTDLPPKTEQTLYCDMLPAQKKSYKELKEYYRVKLAKKVETVGIGRSKIQVLEALLRLRQVACDPRLLDKSSKAGAKLELLGQQISEIASEGHKVLVFSQFTSFLSLVKQQFDEIGIEYEYLDGQSTKRAQSVKRFQEDASVSAFLISIKAGGHGLNLTAADYVFILDPWWNPAVEAQAIDRAHRMGQKNSVIAYRMICRDTVEEKILALQASKRDLADKIIQSDESLIRSLTAEDLQILFA